MITPALGICRITACTGITSEQILAGSCNPFFGISLGNPFFKNPGHLSRYFTWATLVNNRAEIPAVIVDGIHAINLEALDTAWNGVPSSSMLSKALEDGDRMRNIVQKALSSSPNDVAKRVRVWRWDELTRASHGKYEYNLDILMERYEAGPQSAFFRAVNQIVRDLMFERVKRLFPSEDAQRMRLLRLGHYVVHEVALVLGGLDVFMPGSHAPQKFDLSPYPSVSEIQGLISAIENGEGGGDFPQLKKQLRFSGSLRSVTLEPIEELPSSLSASPLSLSD